jgi:hypothetical protein
MADKEERNWRMSGGPQQVAFDNALAAQAVARSPMAGAEMFRARFAAREMDLNRQIQREELGLKRDMMRGDFGERRAARLDAMKMLQAQMGLEREQMTSQMGLGRESLAAQLEQGRQQHAQSMQQGEQSLEAIRAQGRQTGGQLDLQNQMFRNQRRTELKVQYPQASEEQLNALLDKEFGTAPLGPGAPAAPVGTGVGSGTQPGSPAGQTGALPLWAAGMTGQQILDYATDQGWSDISINGLLQSRDPNSNVAYPGGYSALATGGRFWKRLLPALIGNYKAGALTDLGEQGSSMYERPDRKRSRLIDATPEQREWARRMRRDAWINQ